MTFYALYFPHTFEFLGGQHFATAIVFGVASARVFYHCHYYGDTIAGALLGVAIAQMIFFFDLSSAIGVFVNSLPVEWE